MSLFNLNKLLKMKILVDNKPREALQLMLMRPLALDILAGKKRLEVRAFSPYYVKTLLNVDNFNQWVNSGLPKEHKPIFKNKVEFIHFTNRSHSWFLNVSVKQHFVEFVTFESVLQLGREFGFHDLDSELPRLKHLKDNDLIDNIICFEIDKVIETNLTL